MIKVNWRNNNSYSITTLISKINLESLNRAVNHEHFCNAQTFMNVC